MTRSDVKTTVELKILIETKGDVLFLFNGRPFRFGSVNLFRNFLSDIDKLNKEDGLDGVFDEYFDENLENIIDFLDKYESGTGHNYFCPEPREVTFDEIFFSY